MRTRRRYKALFRDYANAPNNWWGKAHAWVTDSSIKTHCGLNYMWHFNNSKMDAKGEWRHIKNRGCHVYIFGNLSHLRMTILIAGNFALSHQLRYYRLYISATYKQKPSFCNTAMGPFTSYKLCRHTYRSALHTAIYVLQNASWLTTTRLARVTGAYRASSLKIILT